MTPDTMPESLERERRFHDAWAQGIRDDEVEIANAFAGSTSPEGAWIIERLGDLTGKRVLELGSGAGEGSINFALRGAQVVATDLSPGMLEVVGRLALRHGVEVETIPASAEDLSVFPDASFDVVYGANLLHHVDIARCLSEVHRVLKPGGQAAFWDPVAYNPAINVYRRLATDVRTPDEHPLRRSDLDLFRKRFAAVEHRFFWLSALAVFLKFYFIDRIHPSADRYWKLIVSREEELRWLVRPLTRLDRLILRICPWLGWWCWNIAVVTRK
jgi:ubiquinone/menaquinone biosynthesis C-methylase UbiE